MKRIAEDKKRVAAQLRPVLEHLECHLFEPDLTVKGLFHACGLFDHNLPVQFHTELGLTPGNYIRAARMETACRLLRDTNLRIWQVAELVGYSRPDAFSDAFAEWEGLRPTRYRQVARSSARRAPARSGDAEPRSWGHRLRAGRLVGGLGDLCDLLRGKVTPEDVRALLDHLHGLYPELGERPCSAAAMMTEEGIDMEAIETPMAEALWVCLRSLPFEEQKEYLCAYIRFTSPAFFQLLCRKSREVGRSGRAKGIPVAQLAIASLEQIYPEFLGPEDGVRLQALGWARLGNAYCLAGDLPNAEMCIAQAEDLITSASCCPSTVGEILYLKGQLMLHRRRLPEALELTERSIAHLRRTEEAHALAKALILQSFVLFSNRATEEALDRLLEALPLIDETRNLNLKYSAVQNIVLCLVALGESREAKRRLREARELVERLGSYEGRAQLLWAEGLLAEGTGHLAEAEALLREAKTGLLEIEGLSCVPLISLDLAAVLYLQGRSSEVVAAVCEILPLLKTRECPPENLAALHILEDAMAGDSTTLELLRVARGRLSKGLAWPRPAWPGS